MKSKCTRWKITWEKVYILCVHFTSRAEGLLLVIGLLETF